MRWGVYGAAPAQVTDAKDTRRPGSLFVYQFIECSDTMCTSEILINSPNACKRRRPPPESSTLLRSESSVGGIGTLKYSVVYVYYIFFI